MHVPNPKGKWSSESLEATMDEVERCFFFLRGVNKFWGIPITSLFDHLYGKTKNKKIGPPSVLIEEEDETIITWVLSM